MIQLKPVSCKLFLIVLFLIVMYTMSIFVRVIIIHLICRDIIVQMSRQINLKMVHLLLLPLFVWRFSVCFDICILQSVFSSVFSPQGARSPGDGRPALQMSWQLYPKACHPVATGRRVSSTADARGHVI